MIPSPKLSLQGDSEFKIDLYFQLGILVSQPILSPNYVSNIAITKNENLPRLSFEKFCSKMSCRNQFSMVSVLESWKIAQMAFSFSKIFENFV